MTKEFDFFLSWFLTNEDKFIGKEVDNVYNVYCLHARECGCKAYYKKTFIEEITLRLPCDIKNGIFVERGF